MKKGEIKRITVKNFDEERDYVGIICKEPTDRLVIFTTKGQTLTFSLDKIVKESGVRLPAETRTLLKNFSKSFEKEEALKEKLAEVQKEKQEISPRALAKSLGLLTEQEFVDAFIENLTEDVKRAWDNGKYRAYFYGFRSEPIIQIESNQGIEKYFRGGSFVFLEYDGTLMFTDDAEKDKNYRAYVKKYRKDLPIKAKATASLQLGDKDWLICETSYEVKVTKPLTEKYAKELAEKFCR